MDFDKSRVYTALNADELKVGSKVICADTLAELKEYVETDYCMYILRDILDEENTFRFDVDSGEQYALAYLISEPEEKKLKWTDLKIGDVIKHKREHVMFAMVNVIDFSDSVHVHAGGTWLADIELAEEWEKVEEDNE